MVQLAELDAGHETLDATLNYFVDTKEIPVSLVGAPGKSDKRVGGGNSEPHRVSLRNGRHHAGEFALEQNGFRFVPHHTRVADFYDEDEIRRVYYPEMEALIKAEAGAKRVVVFDHTLRTADDELRQAAKIREVVRRVHNDYTEWSGPQRVRDLMGGEAEELLRHRFAIVQVWRPIRHPVESWPLGDRRRAEPGARRHGGDRAPLCQPRRPDLGDHLEPRPSLVLVPADAARRGIGVQGVQLAEGRPRPLHRAHRLRRPDDAAPSRGRAKASKSAPWRFSEFGC